MELFEIKEKPLFSKMESGFLDKIPNKKGLFVDDKCINIVTDRYSVTQPSEVYKRFEDSSHFKITNCLSNPNTGGLLLSAKLQTVNVCNFDHDVSLSFYTSHSGHSNILALQGLNHNCWNQIPVMIGCHSRHLVKHRHLHEFDFNNLEKILETLPLHISNFKLQYEKLQDLKYSKDRFIDDFVKHFNIQDNQKDKTVAKITDLYNHAKGQNNLNDNSGMKAFQAVTYHLTHNVKESKNKLENVHIKNQDKAHTWFDIIANAA